MVNRIWHSVVLRSSEHFVAQPSGDGHSFRGVVVLPIDNQPGHISYQVQLDAGWRTRRADIEAASAGTHTRIEIVADATGAWECNGEALSALSGCVDVDLGWTPATNTLQIRRLGLHVGARQTVDVAWLRFPELTLERSRQTYERLGDTTWRFSSDGFTAVLEVDDFGYVLRYGENLWTTVV